MGRDWALALLIVGAVFLAYSPVWKAGFMWDDDNIVTGNPVIVGPFGLREIWTSGAARYYPLVLSTFWLEHALWGLAPLGFHLVTVLFHSASAIVLWSILRQLDIRGAWLGAALWALHPVQVETVAWVSETKNTESALFFLLSVFFFLRGVRAEEAARPRGFSGGDVLGLLCAALAMMSKSTALLLPFVLLLCLWWIKGRWRWSDAARVVPYALLAAVAGLIVVGIVRHFGGSESQWTQSWPERIVMAGNIFWFYLAKLLWPLGLMAVYPGWPAVPLTWVLCLPAAMLAAACGLLWLGRNFWARPVIFAFAFYLLNLLPVIGLFGVTGFRYSPAEDHLQYLASIGPLALAGAGLATLPRMIPAIAVWFLPSCATVLLLLLGTISWKQAWVYQDIHTFWVYNLAQNPRCWLAYNNLGSELARQGRSAEALRYYQKCLEIEPDNDLVHYNLGCLLSGKGDWEGAAAEYRKAIAADSYLAAAELRLGEVLVKLNQPEEAIAHERRAAYLDPLSALPHSDLGVLLFQQGKIAEAIAEDKAALEADPASGQTWTNLALALTQSGITQLQQGDVAGAIAQFQEALRSDPNLAQAHSNLGVAYAKTGDLADAQSEFAEAVRLRPDDAAAQDNLARIEAMIQQGQSRP